MERYKTKKAWDPVAPWVSFLRRCSLPAGPVLTFMYLIRLLTIVYHRDTFQHLNKLLERER